MDKAESSKLKLIFAFKIALVILLLLFLSFCVWVGSVLTHYTPPILMYHYVNVEEPLKSKLGITPNTFERQMRFLRERKYNIITLDELADLIKDKKKIPFKTAVITFDDGYLDNYTNVFPILKKYRIPATIFVVVDRLGRRLGNDDYLNIAQLKEMIHSGLITIGSHSLSHPNLSEDLSEDELRREIGQSKQIIEETLGVPVNLFSYPFGGISPKARNLVKESGYKSAVGTNFPKGYPSDDIFALKRLRISENARNLIVFWIEISGFYNYIKEQRDDY